jgi:hypothetical protein
MMENVNQMNILVFTHIPTSVGECKGGEPQTLIINVDLSFGASIQPKWESFWGLESYIYFGSLARKLFKLGFFNIV